MKIIKNLKYFLMLGCLSFATFTFAETTANQNADKQAVQKQLSKKLNDLSIHIETFENMLKTINANDFNDIKNRLDSFKDSIEDQSADIETLKDKLDSIDVNYFDDVKNRLGELETKINGLTTNLKNYRYITESGNVLRTYYCENKELTSKLYYKKWSDGYLEQYGMFKVDGDSYLDIKLEYEYESDLIVLGVRSGIYYDYDAGFATHSIVKDNGMNVRIENGSANSDWCTFYVFGYEKK